MTYTGTIIDDLTSAVERAEKSCAVQAGSAQAPEEGEATLASFVPAGCLNVQPAPPSSGHCFDLSDEHLKVCSFCRKENALRMAE